MKFLILWTHQDIGRRTNDCWDKWPRPPWLPRTLLWYKYPLQYFQDLDTNHTQWRRDTHHMFGGRSTHLYIHSETRVMWHSRDSHVTQYYLGTGIRCSCCFRTISDIVRMWRSVGIDCYERSLKWSHTKCTGQDNCYMWRHSYTTHHHHTPLYLDNTHHIIACHALCTGTICTPQYNTHHYNNNIPRVLC